MDQKPIERIAALEKRVSDLETGLANANHYTEQLVQLQVHLAEIESVHKSMVDAAGSHETSVDNVHGG